MTIVERQRVQREGDAVVRVRISHPLAGWASDKDDLLRYELGGA